MIKKINTTDDSSDPVFVSTIGQRIELRIGYANRGETRFAALRLSEARAIAEELIRQAEALAEANKKKQAQKDFLKVEGLDDLF